MAIATRNRRFEVVETELKYHKNTLFLVICSVVLFYALVSVIPTSDPAEWTLEQYRVFRESRGV